MESIVIIFTLAGYYLTALGTTNVEYSFDNEIITDRIITTVSSE